jgi:hypothetical protein
MSAHGHRALRPVGPAEGSPGRLALGQRQQPVASPERATEALISLPPIQGLRLCGLAGGVGRESVRFNRRRMRKPAFRLRPLRSIWLQ